MGANNLYKFVLDGAQKYINIPVEMKWDFGGRQDDIDKFEETVLKDLLGTKDSYEISRYSHKEYGNNLQTSITYDFYFYNSPTPVSATTIVNSNFWQNTYLFNSAIPSGFSSTELYYYRKVFTKSFFKIDFYDTPNSTTQKLYFTLILPTQQGATESVSISPLLPNVDVKKPSIKLDFVGDKEGYFIYWLRTPEVLPNDTFYMSAKFFDARFGVFVRMMTEPQSSLPNKFTFDTERYYFYKVKIDFDTKKYEVFDYQNLRIGAGTPINWYEYINP